MLLLHELEHGAKPILVMHAKTYDVLVICRGNTLWALNVVHTTLLDVILVLDRNVENGRWCTKMRTNGHWLSKQQICIYIQAMSAVAVATVHHSVLRPRVARAWGTTGFLVSVSCHAACST
jgi:hypothetical protein